MSANYDNKQNNKVDVVPPPGSVTGSKDITPTLPFLRRALFTLATVIPGPPLLLMVRRSGGLYERSAYSFHGSVRRRPRSGIIGFPLVAENAPDRQMLTLQLRYRESNTERLGVRLGGRGRRLALFVLLRIWSGAMFAGGGQSAPGTSRSGRRATSHGYELLLAYIRPRSGSEILVGFGWRGSGTFFPLLAGERGHEQSYTTTRLSLSLSLSLSVCVCVC